MVSISNVAFAMVHYLKYKDALKVDHPLRYRMHLFVMRDKKICH